MTPFSNRMETAEPSMVRELWKYWLSPEYHSLCGGSPSQETFPVSEIEKITSQLLEECKKDDNLVKRMFSYGETEGDEILRSALIKRYMQKYHNGNPEKDTLAVFTGGQQIIDLTIKAFVNSGDIIAVEESTYAGLMSCAWGYEAKMKGISTDSDGMIPSALEKVLQEEKNVKLIYLVATFNNPTGTVTSFERRQEIYKLAVKYDVMILEDSPYFELRYSGEYIPSIKSIDQTGHVIFAGSLSKILFPGLRIGFAIADKKVMAKLVVGKQCEDLNNPGMLQLIAGRYLTDYDVDAHIDECCNLYRKKRDAMIAALEKYMNTQVKWTCPDGGFFLWLTLPRGMSGDKFCKYIIEKEKVLVACGSGYRPDGEDVNAIRLNFSVPSIAEIDLCIKRIADCFTSFVDKMEKNEDV